ncbi:MAG: hypothetical protein GTO60_16595 [Gammaproteobacteria bacterium]|nr:hypothetical protein [Gammaproteobacteria bacterium]
MSELNWYECTYEQRIYHVLARDTTCAISYMVFMLRTCDNEDVPYDNMTPINVAVVAPENNSQERRWVADWLEWSGYDRFVMRTIITRLWGDDE